MRLSNKIVEELVSEIAGGDTIPLVQQIKDKTNVSEFKIAENLKITVNQVRNMLYRLQAHNLVSFIRKKDKKKGWYIYYWTFNQKQARDLALELKKEKLELLIKMLNKEKDSCYFICPDSCVRFNFENAMEHQFKCPECNRVLVQEDNVQRLEGFRREIKELGEEIVASKIAIQKVRERKKRLKPPKKSARKKKTKKIKEKVVKSREVKEKKVIKKKKTVETKIPKPKVRHKIHKSKIKRKSFLTNIQRRLKMKRK